MRSEPFETGFVLDGGQVLAELRVPLRNPDYAPFLQNVRDLKPDALFVFIPAGGGSALLKQFVERGLDKAKIKLVGEGSVVDDEILNAMGDAALGLVTSHPYSVAHKSPANLKFVAAFMKQSASIRPTFSAYRLMTVCALSTKRLRPPEARATAKHWSRP